MARATCDSGIATYGVHFGSIGHFHVERKQVELLPEEALYMNERGAIELWRETEEGARVPMSIQQAWGALIGYDELTPERYQVSLLLSLDCWREADLVLFQLDLRLPEAIRLHSSSSSTDPRSRATSTRSTILPLLRYS